MARIFTADSTQERAISLMHDFAVAGGILSKSQRVSATRIEQYLTRPEFKQSAEVICDELVNRNFDNIDSTLARLASGYYTTVSMKVSTCAKVYTSALISDPATIAKSIVYMAQLLDIYWDDTIRTPYEIEEFKKTYLGTAVYKYGRYISAIKPAKKTTGGRTTSTGAKIAGYKQSGPQSSNVRDLIGTPGTKVQAVEAFIYKIIADKTGKNTPNVFIKPLSGSGAAGSTNKIFFSSGNGYTDCTCYFDSYTDAADFLAKLTGANKVPANINNPRIARLRPDSNGYFSVGTEFGHCKISAKTLNEALEEQLNQKELDEGCAKGAEKNTWKKTTEKYTQDEKQELHTWMRRG